MLQMNHQLTYNSVRNRVHFYILYSKYLQGQTVTLKLKNVLFETITRAKKLSRPTNNLDLIYMTARRLLQVEMEHNSSLEIRLMGNVL